MHPRFVTAVLGVVALFVCARMATAQDVATAPRPTATALPAPNEKGSHEKYRAALTDARGEKYASLLAIFDQWIAAHPDDVDGAVERCRFILGEETDEITVDDTCTKDLVERFPTAGAVYRLRLERIWGDEAIAFALKTMERRDVKWSDRDVAELFRSVAWSYSMKQRSPQAAAWALLARKPYDVDVSLLLARHLQAIGQRKQAIAELLRPSEDGDVYSKLSLLVELGAFDEALKIINAETKKGTAIDAMLHARALEGAGLTDAARAKYGELSDQKWQRRAVLQRLLYIDIAHDDRTRAVASYEALRAEGFKADPFLRHRLALALAFPTVGWQWRDLLGVFAFFGCFLLCLVVPAIGIMPIHYLSLVRRERGVVLGPKPRWTLTKLWVTSASFLWLTTVAMYIYDHDTLAETFLDAFYTTEKAPPARLARYFVLQVVAGCLVVGVWLRRGDYARLIRSSWSYRSIVGRIVLSLFVLGIARRFAQAVGLDTEDVSHLGATATTLELIRAVYTEFGPWILFPVIAVLVPIYEEMFFRGIFLGSVARHVPFAWANVFQASIFMLAHDEPAHYPQLFVLAVIAGLMVRRSGGLAPAIALHAVVNTIAGFGIIMSTATMQPDQGVQDFNPKNIPASARRKFANASFGTVARACDEGDAAACHVLAGWSYTRKTDRLAKPCEDGVAESCTQLGELYLRGNDAPRDPTKAARLFRKACNAGDVSGCVAFDALREHADAP